MSIIIHGRTLSEEETDAILAGLRLLANDMRDGVVAPNDSGVGCILTNAGLHDGLKAEQVDALGDEINGAESESLD